LEQLIAEGQASALMVTIHVEKFNPALRVYKRLGFSTVEERGAYWFLRWSPGAGTGVSEDGFVADARRVAAYRNHEYFDGRRSLVVEGIGFLGQERLNGALKGQGKWLSIGGAVRLQGNAVYELQTDGSPFHLKHLFSRESKKESPGYRS
jgi:hypothetical protein